MNFKELDSYVKKIGKTYNVPCYDFCAYYDKKTVYKKRHGFSSPDKKIKISRKKLYFMHSGAKLIVSVALMKLVENKKVSLDDNVKTFLPNFPTDDNVAKLLYEYSRTLDYEQEIYNFSNISKLIENISEVSFNEFIETNITKPLNMKSTTFELSFKNKKKIAVQYVFNSKTAQITESNTGIYDLYYKNKGCLITTVDDYGKFCKTLSSGGVSDNGYTLLTKDNIELLFNSLLYNETKKGNAFVCMGYNGGLVLIDIKKKISMVYAQHIENIPASQLEMYPVLRRLTYESLGVDTWEKDYVK